MKKCNNCNAVLQDDSIFCHECGTQYTQLQPQQNTEPEQVSQASENIMPAEQTPIVDEAPVVSATSIAPQKTEQPHRDALISSVRSAPFIVMLISCIVYYLFLITSSVLQLLHTQNIYDTLSQMSEAASFSIIPSITGISLFAIIAILSVFSVCSVYAWARKPSSSRPVGFAIVKIFNILSIILYSLVLSVILGMVAWFALTVLPAVPSEFFELLLYAVIAVAVPLIAYFTVIIIYHARVIHTVNGASEICTKGYTNKKPSTYIAVLMCIFSVYLLLNLLSNAWLYLFPTEVFADTIRDLIYQEYEGYRLMSEAIVLIENILAVISRPLYMGLIMVAASISQIVHSVSLTLFIAKYNFRLKIAQKTK